MTASRGTLRSRIHPRRSGQFAVLALTCLALLCLTFFLGFLVGRQAARGQQREARVEQDKQAVLPGRVPAPKAWVGARDREVGRLPQIQERLTFYHTLTAPPGSAPTTPALKARDASAAVKEPEKERAWTLQVGAYRSRSQAGALQRALVASGYDGYLTAVTGQDGAIHYRVRVGSYPTRAEAEQVSERLRTERSLAPFIVPW